MSGLVERRLLMERVDVTRALRRIALQGALTLPYAARGLDADAASALAIAIDGADRALGLAPDEGVLVGGCQRAQRLERAPVADLAEGRSDDAAHGVMFVFELREQGGHAARRAQAREADDRRDALLVVLGSLHHADELHHRVGFGASAEAKRRAGHAGCEHRSATRSRGHAIFCAQEQVI